MDESYQSCFLKIQSKDEKIIKGLTEILKILS
jgi:hypothetical protein